MYEFGTPARRGSVMSEIGRQSRVFFDDPETEGSVSERYGDMSGAEGESRRVGEWDDGDGDEEELVEQAEEEAQREIEEGDAEEDKDRVGMEGEREREEEAVQEFLGEDGKKGGGTVVG